ncbi:hypothetical protein B296_00030352 [Ensete ventricosum]|uniref:Uncharacterized protein n=1 Tax=Ensete ventricosum TaxID=4639 RepID=A0A426YAY1_ENSVE|nr:hypothetical protein B296_00030352 [Ensete ventricosum]
MGKKSKMLSQREAEEEMARRLCWGGWQLRLRQKHDRGRGKKVRRALATRVEGSGRCGRSTVTAERRK